MKPKKTTRKSRPVASQLDRGVTRRAVLLAFGAVLGKYNTMHASEAYLTVNLDQWKALVFSHKGRLVTVPVAEIFDALVEGQP